jgi:hypothetical protein
MWAGKSATPPDALKVCRARRLVWKQPLKLWQRARNWQLASQKHIDSRSPRIDANFQHTSYWGVCDNRISTVGWLDRLNGYGQIFFMPMPDHLHCMYA